MSTNASLMVCPLRNFVGAVIRYLKVSQDIAERKHYEECRRKKEKNGYSRGLSLGGNRA